MHTPKQASNPLPSPPFWGWRRRRRFWFRLRCLHRYSHRLLILFICVYMQLYSKKIRCKIRLSITCIHTFFNTKQEGCCSLGHWPLRVYRCARQIQYYFSFNQSEYVYAEPSDAQPIRILLLLFSLLLLLLLFLHVFFIANCILILSFNFPIRAQCRLNQCSNEKSFQKLINDLVN